MQFLYKWPESLKTIVDYLVELKTPHSVTIEPPKRSNQQNKCLHDNVGIIADHTGYSIEEMKLIIKEWVTKTGKLKMVEEKRTEKVEFKVYRSTKDLDTKEFGILMDYVFELWATLWLTMNIPAVQFANEIFN